MSQNEKAQKRNSEAMLYVHVLYYLFMHGPINKDEIEEKMFSFLKENNLFFPEDLEINESRESRSRPEKIYQQLRNLAKSNKSLAPSFFIKETATHYELAKPIFNALKTVVKGTTPATTPTGKEGKRPDSYAGMENVIFFGPPGTGKTFLAKKENSDFARQIVQFHPSYSYENFVQGERLVSVGDMRLTQVIDGPLMLAYRKATNTAVSTKAKISKIEGNVVTLSLPLGLLGKYEIPATDKLYISFSADPTAKQYETVEWTESKLKIEHLNEAHEINSFVEIYFKAESWSEMRPQVVIIDEINRADIAKVFGELLNALADVGTSKSSDYVQLQYSGEKFFWPGNMRIIGTMNSADRSIGEIDQAIKRRFRLKEIKPDLGLFSKTNHFKFFGGLRELIENNVDKRTLDATTKNLISSCENTADEFVRFYNHLGKLHNLEEKDFCYLSTPTNSLKNLHTAILKNKDSLFRATSKLIGHSFHIQFLEDLVVTVKQEIGKGALSEKEFAIDLGQIVRARLSILIDQEIFPQVESICMGNDTALNKIMENWLQLEKESIQAKDEQIVGTTKDKAS